MQNFRSTFRLAIALAALMCAQRAHGDSTVQSPTQTVQITGVTTVIVSEGEITATLTGTPNVTVSGGVDVNNFPAQQHVLVDNTIQTSTFAYVTNIATHVSVDNTIATTTHTWVDNQVTASTHVSVDNFPASQAVTGTFFQATQPVSFQSPTVYLATTSVSGTVNVVSTNTLLVSASTTPVVLLRPSQGTGRTYVTGFGDALSGSTTIYTVTSGKKLYVTSMNISGFNTSTTNPLRLRIQDGGTTVIPISAPTAGLGATLASVPLSLAGDVFPEPKQFSTNVNVTVVTGTVTYSFDFTGYEE